MRSGECRVISVNREAVREWLFETVLEKKEMLFALERRKEEQTDLLLSMKWDDVTGDLICVISRFDDHQRIDLDRIKCDVRYTTETLFKQNRHVTYLLDENRVQERKKKYYAKRRNRGGQCEGGI